MCRATRRPSTHTRRRWLTDSKRIAYTPARGTMTVVRYQATEPANERSPAAPRTWRALGEKGTVTVRPAKWPPRQPSAAPRPARSPRTIHGPSSAPRAGRARGRGQRRRRALLLADGARHQREDRHHGRQAGGQHPPPRSAHQPSRIATTRAGLARPIAVRVEGLLTTLLTAIRARRLRRRGGRHVRMDDSSVVEDGDDARRRRAGADDAQREAAHAEPRARQRAEVDEALDLRVGQVGLVGGPEDARLAAARCASWACRCSGRSQPQASMPMTRTPCS